MSKKEDDDNFQEDLEAKIKMHVRCPVNGYHKARIIRGWEPRQPATEVRCMKIFVIYYVEKKKKKKKKKKKEEMKIQSIL